MSKTVEQWKAKAIAGGWRWSDNEECWIKSSGEYADTETLKELYDTTTPSPDVAGSDAVGFAEFIGKNGWWTEDGLTWFNEISGGDDTVQISTTISDLYAKFNPNPQPAGASVGIEEAADSYARDTYDNFPYAVVAMDSFKAGAAFQAAQQPKGMNPFDYAKNIVKMEEQPAPAAVSAGTWVTITGAKDYPKPGPAYFVKIGALSDKVVWTSKKIIERFLELQREDRSVTIQYLDESAPDIPDVRELVEAANDVIGSMFWQYKARNGKMMSIEADGEKCWIVPDEKIELLKTALSNLKQRINE